MRISFSRLAAFFAFLIVASLFAPGARAQNPVVTAFIGTQTANTKIGYFVLDFNDPGPTPEVYTFGYFYEGNPTGAAFLLALEASLTGTNGFQQTGAASNFVTRLGYNGRSKFNDFGGNNSGDPNGFWSLWLGNTEPRNSTNLIWANAQFGAAGVTLSDTPVFSVNPFTGLSELSGAQWHGWRWVPDFGTGDGGAPRPLFAAAAATAPEPSAVALFGFGVLALGRLRRRK